MFWLCLGNASYLQGTLAFFEIEEQDSGPAGLRAQLSVCQDMSIPTQELVFPGILVLSSCQAILAYDSSRDFSLLFPPSFLSSLVFCDDSQKAKEVIFEGASRKVS